ncbi:MAG: DICT sensory domain-containing protein [Haloarculaceae archaeon]
MTLRDFIEEAEDRDRSMVVFETGAGDGAESIERVARFFEDGTLSRGREPGLVTQFASFLPDEGLVAVSTLDEFDGDYLLVDSSFEVVGTLPRERIDAPELVVRVDEATFLVAAGNTPLLTEMSHHIEELALDRDAGTLWTGMQELSRLGEPRTRAVYERLADSGVEAHVFGRAGESDPDPGVQTHGDATKEIRESWFVVYRADVASAALVATETEPGTFRGFWTFETDLADRVGEYVRRTYGT